MDKLVFCSLHGTEFGLFVCLRRAGHVRVEEDWRRTLVDWQLNGFILCLRSLATLNSICTCTGCRVRRMRPVARGVHLLLLKLSSYVGRRPIRLGAGSYQFPAVFFLARSIVQSWFIRVSAVHNTEFLRFRPGHVFPIRKFAGHVCLSTQSGSCKLHQLGSGHHCGNMSHWCLLS